MSVKFGNRMMQARKEKALSREALAEKVGISGPIIGRYERNEMMPSVEIATKIAAALEVSLDFLVGHSSLPVKDKNVPDRLEEIAQLPNDKQTELLNAIEAYHK